MRTCLKCHLTKPDGEFGPSLVNRSGLTSWCRECLAAYNRERRLGIKTGTWNRKNRQRQVGLNTPRPTVIPVRTDLAWAAGFLEGEGSFTRTRGYVRVKAVQVNVEPLLRLQRLFGGNIYGQKVYGGRQPSFAWIVNAKMAQVVVHQIYEFLSLRRKSQVDAMMGKMR